MNKKKSERAAQLRSQADYARMVKCTTQGAAQRAATLASIAARAAPGARLLSKRDMLDRIGVSFPTIWKWMREGTFPRSVVIGTKTAWIEAEVEAWIAALPRRQLKGDVVQAAEVAP